MPELPSPLSSNGPPCLSRSRSLSGEPGLLHPPSNNKVTLLHLIPTGRVSKEACRTEDLNKMESLTV